MYTQCPQCQAIFQLSAEQLKAAGGDVRCGQCLTIFNAIENLSEAPPNQETPATTDASRSDANHYADWAADSEVATSPEPAPQPESIHNEEPAQEPATAIPEETAGEAFDFGDIEAAAAEVYGTTAPDEGIASPDEGEQASGQSEIPPMDMAPSHEEGAEVVTVAEEKAEFDEHQASHQSLAPEEVINIELEDIPVRAEAGQPPSAEEPPAETEKAVTAPKPPQTETTTAAEAAIPTLIREQLEEAKAEQLRRPSKVWGVGSILLMLVFVGQALFFSRHELARDATLGPWIIKACKLLNCTIQRPEEIDQIAILGWDVRSHPTVPKALIASTTLVNNAAFSQPFPLLELRFSDMNGLPVSQRRFKPQEYLGDPALVKQGMQPDTPTHVELELLDPGKNAVNFEFHPVALPHISAIQK
jgi:predicted Zn finger-like uncharacterized protein